MVSTASNEGAHRRFNPKHGKLRAMQTAEVGALKARSRIYAPDFCDCFIFPDSEVALFDSFSFLKDISFDQVFEM